MPKVSVCMPSYNLAPFIFESIGSVLGQTFRDFEFLIEDDGSTDKSTEVIRSCIDERIRFIAKRENQGANETTNNLVKRATGEYIALLPADDVWEKDKLQEQVEYLDAHPECGIVFGWPRFIDQNGEPLESPNKSIESLENVPVEEWRTRLKDGNCFYIATCLYRRSLHDELGYFATDLTLLGDLEWYVRILKKHGVHVIQRPLAKIRQRGMDNLSAPTFSNLVANAEQIDRINALHYPIDRSKRKILIATPFYEVKGYSPYIKSLVQTIHWLSRYSGIEFDWTDRSGDSYVWRARNAMADFFMRSDCTEMVFIDSDQGWSLEAFVRLINADVELVGAAYPVKNNWEHYGVTIHTKGPNNVPDLDEKTGLIRGEKVPTGFMKIKRSVFEKLQKAQPENWYWESGKKMHDHFGHLTLGHVKYGEDISFVKRCAAIGITAWVEPRCDISHIGTHTWYGNYHKYLLKQKGGSNAPAIAS